MGKTGALISTAKRIKKAFLVKIVLWTRAQVLSKSGDSLKDNPVDDLTQTLDRMPSESH